MMIVCLFFADYDRSGTMNSPEEVSQITINLLYACAKQTELAVSAKVMDRITKEISNLELDDTNAWSVHDFERWFNEAPLEIARDEALKSPSSKRVGARLLTSMQQNTPAAKAGLGA